METIDILIKCDTLDIADCVSAILVPEIAISEPGYIKTVTINADAHSKHEFYAMAQMAYYQYQDDELDIVSVTAPVTVRMNDTVEEIVSGMIIYRDGNGEIHAVMHDHLNRKKIFESTNRYCTRWVRLDI